MARPRKQQTETDQQNEVVQSADPIIIDAGADATFNTELVESPDNTLPVSVQAQTAPASGVLKSHGVYLRSKKTNRVIAGPIPQKQAQVQTKAYPNLVEIVESI